MGVILNPRHHLHQVIHSQLGYLYFGARYYDSDVSVWLSVDPLARKYPSTSPFMYVRGNPVILVDPTGMSDNRFGFGKRMKNWFRKEGWKNKANKFAVRNKLNSNTDNNGNIKMTKSYTYSNKKSKSTGIVEEDYVFTKEGIYVEQRNSTIAETSFHKIDYKGFKGILVYGAGLGTKEDEIGNKGRYFTTIDLVEFNNIINPQPKIDFTKKEKVPMIWIGGDSNARYKNKYYMNGDTIRYVDVYVTDSIECYYDEGKNLCPAKDKK